MVLQRLHFCLMLAMVFLSAVGFAGDAGAQAGCFGEYYPVGILAGSANSDGLLAGRAMSLLANPAHAVWGTRWSAGGGYRQLYGLQKLQRVWGAGKYRRESWGVGITVMNLGQSDFYTETMMDICFALRVRRNLAVGVKVKYLQLAYTPEMPRYTGWSVGLGVLYQPFKEVLLGGAISRLVCSEFIPNYSLPRQYVISAAYLISPEIQCGGSWKKSEGDRDVLGFGQRLGLVKNLYFVAAVYVDTARYALGGEIVLRGQSIFYTYLSHPDLGGTHYVEFEVGR